MFLVICYVSKRKIMPLVNLTSELSQGQFLLIAFLCVYKPYFPVSMCVSQIFFENWTF